MSPEEVKEIVEQTVNRFDFWSGMLMACVPVVITIILNAIYDMNRRTSEIKRKVMLEQLKELYLPLYTMISQSEYIRYFYEMKQPFDEIPFSEIHKTTKKSNLNLRTGKLDVSEEKIIDDITEVNKKNIDKMIISKSQYASPELIKLAVAHRYLESNYLSELANKEISQKFSNDEVKILSKLIKLIVKETNEKLKYCKLPYNKSETENNIMDTKIYN